MMSRKPDDVTGWIYQANIHGTYDQPVLKDWNQCQHGSFFFPSWHRMYLYYFERILRAASGDSTFALPYWDYTSPAERALPIVFRQPADESNPLYITARAEGVNEGAQLPASATSYSVAFGYVNFSARTSSSLSFGGQELPAPVHFGQPHGQLEQQPHDVIHDLLGGQDGDMSDPNLAARDPIFWLHHSNIDRLWKRWLDQGGGRSDPIDNSVWMNQTFSFYDENGAEQQLSGKDILETQEQLCYAYDDDPPPVARRAVVALAAAPPPPPTPPGGARPSTPAVLASSPEAHPMELGDQPVSVTLDLPESARAHIETALATPAPGAPVGEVALNLEGISFDKRPGVYYEIYLNLPRGQEPDPRSIYYVGNLSFFGLKPHGPAGGGHNQPEGAAHASTEQVWRGYRITDLVRQQVARKTWNPGKVTVTFVERGLIPPKGKAKASRPGTKARVAKLTITRS
jgi:tyrosinase